MRSAKGTCRNGKSWLTVNTRCVNYYLFINGLFVLRYSPRLLFNYFVIYIQFYICQYFGICEHSFAVPFVLVLFLGASPSCISPVWCTGARGCTGPNSCTDTCLVVLVHFTGRILVGEPGGGELPPNPPCTIPASYKSDSAHRRGLLST